MVHLDIDWINIMIILLNGNINTFLKWAFIKRLGQIIFFQLVVLCSSDFFLFLFCYLLVYFTLASAFPYFHFFRLFFFLYFRFLIIFHSFSLFLYRTFSINYWINLILMLLSLFLPVDIASQFFF